MKQLDVLVLSDVSSDPAHQDFSADLHKPEWETERHVLEALGTLGHRARLICLYDRIDPLLQAIREHRPDVVFNLAEQFNDDPTLERSIAALIELLRIPYTGSGPTGLMLCKNKALTKTILSFHRVRTPHFTVMHQGRAIRRPARLPFPLFVKALRVEASVGIAKASFVETDAELADRVRFIHEKIGQPALVEEFIVGRELYVSILGNTRLSVLPLRELTFGDIPPDEPRFATFKMKWDDHYRKKWGIRNRFATGLDAATARRIAHIGTRVYRMLQMHGYGRIDLRLRDDGTVFVLEANPNPHLAKGEDFAESAAKSDIPYPKLIQQILALSLRAGSP